MFHSTPPMQGATKSPFDLLLKFYLVSIHAPYAGSDGSLPEAEPGQDQFQSTPPMQGATIDGLIGCCKDAGFNPRPLCRERLDANAYYWVLIGFQSTPPMQGATASDRGYLPGRFVSIHAPYAGSDQEVYGRDCEYCEFQSTPPMQGATLCIRESDSFRSGFNPRPLCRERRNS